MVCINGTVTNESVSGSVCCGVDKSAYVPYVHAIKDVTLGDYFISAKYMLATPQSSAPATDDGIIYYDSSSNTFKFRENGAWVELGNASPGGSDTEVQFNDSGSFAGDSGFTYNKTTNALSVTGNVIANNFYVGDDYAVVFPYDKLVTYPGTETYQWYPNQDKVFRYYVKPTGNDSNDGQTWATAKRQPQSVLDDLPGDLMGHEVWILISGGTYEPVNVTKLRGKVSFEWLSDLNNTNATDFNVWVREGNGGASLGITGKDPVIFESTDTTVAFNLNEPPGGIPATIMFNSYDRAYSYWWVGAYAERFVFTSTSNPDMLLRYWGTKGKLLVYCAVKFDLKNVKGGMATDCSGMLVGASFYGGTGDASNKDLLYWQWNAPLNIISFNDVRFEINQYVSYVSGYALPHSARMLYFEDVKYAITTGNRLGTDTVFGTGTNDIVYHQNASAYTKAKIYISGPYHGDMVYDSSMFELREEGTAVHSVYDINTGVGTQVIPFNTSIGTGETNTDYTLTFNGESSQGTFTFMEDEDRLDWDTNLKIDGKLTVTGLIDPTGLELTPQSSAPNTNNGMIYYDSTAKCFYFREDGSWSKYLGTTLTGDFDANSYKIVNLGSPTASTDATNKSYVDSVASGTTSWKDAVDDFYDPTAGTPAGPSTGDRYISEATANGWTKDNIYEYDGSAWVETVTASGDAAYVIADTVAYVFNGTSWVIFNNGGDHGSLSGLSDDDHTQYHNDSRALTWLGTKSTSDLSEGANLYYTDERAQDAVGTILTDSTSINFTYSDATPSITATVLPAGVDHDTLDNVHQEVKITSSPSFDSLTISNDIAISGTVDGRDVSVDGTKLDTIETNAEVNNISDVNATDLTDGGDSSLHYHSTDRDRANHTGTQTASTISDFDTEVSNNTDVTANTAKVSNATHTGEVTGSTALTIADNVVDEANLKVSNSPTNDYILTADSGVSGGMKWAAASSGFTDPMTTRGDIIFRDATNTTTRLATGTANQVIQSDGTDISWQTLAASDIYDFDTEVSNNTDVTANTAKNSYPSTDSTKVGFITVTQAVDLDTMESDIDNLKQEVNVETITANKTLVAGTDEPIQVLDAASSYSVTLSTTNAVSGDRFTIINNNAYNTTNSFSIVLDGTAAGNLYANTRASYVFDGTSWISNSLGSSEGNSKDYNIAIGKSTNATSYGLAIGLNANAYSKGVAIGRGSSGYLSGVGVGYNASGERYSTAVGYYASASQYGVAVGHYASTNSKYYATALGYYSKAERYNELTFSIDHATTNKNNWSVIGLKGTTTDATLTELYCGASGERINIIEDSILSFKAQVSAIDTTSGDTAVYHFEGAIKNIGGTTSIVGTINKSIIAEDDSSWDCDFSADDTYDALVVKVTGDASNSVKWSVRVDTVEARV